VRIALCFYGFLRTFEKTHHSFINHLVNRGDVDVFLYSPNIRNDGDGSAVSSEYIVNNFRASLVNYNLFHYDTAVFKSLTSWLQLPEKEYWNSWVGDTYKSLSMFFQIMNVLCMKEQHEKKNNFEYDVVILSRPDIMIMEPFQFDRDMTKVYFSGPPTTPHIAPIIGSNPIQYIADHIIMTNSKNMSGIKNVYNLIQWYSREGIIINNETLLGFYLIKNKIEIVNQKFTSYELMKQ